MRARISFDAKCVRCFLTIEDSITSVICWVEQYVTVGIESVEESIYRGSARADNPTVVVLRAEELCQAVKTHPSRVIITNAELAKLEETIKPHSQFH